MLVITATLSADNVADRLTRRTTVLGTLYIPITRAMAVFDRESLMEIDVLYHVGSAAADLAARIKARLVARHGSEDLSAVTRDQMLEVLGSVLQVLPLAVGAPGAISLLVGGIGILTITTIPVDEHTAEVGLLAGVVPALRAAGLDPVGALRAE